MTKVPINFRAYQPEADEMHQRAAAANLSLTDYLISCSTTSGAWRANRVRGPVTASTVEAEEAAKRKWWLGDPSSPTCWPALDHVLADLGPTFANIDFRSALFAEQMLRRPDVVQTAYNYFLDGKDDPVPLVRSAFVEWFEEENEAAFDAFSVDDTTKLLICDGATDYETRLAANANNRGDHLEYCLAEAERAGVAGRRAHCRRILRDWRERGIPWPKIEINRHGTPYLADGVRVEMRVINNRRQPVLTSEPIQPPRSRAPARRPLPNPFQGKTMDGSDA